MSGKSSGGELQVIGAGFGRSGTTSLRQALHFIRHDGEAATRVARHGSLDRRIERENVGLVGDVVNERDDLGNLGAGCTHPLNRADRALEGATQSD